MHRRPETKIVRPLRGGQITIPAAFRRQLGISDTTLLQVSVSEGELRIRPVSLETKNEDTAWLQQLYDLFAPVREEAAKRYTSEQIDGFIDEAVTAVRRSKQHG